MKRSTPIEAAQIAAECTVRLKELRTAPTKAALDAAYDQFRTYAKARGVAKQIQDHFVEAFTEQAETFAGQRADRKPQRDFTSGERE